MSGTFYKAFGFAVWKGARWYLRRRMGFGRRAAGMAAGLGAAALTGAAVILQRRNGHNKH